MVLFAEDGPRAHRIWVDTLDKKERHFAELYSLDLNELFDVDLLMQAQLGLLIYFSQRTVHRLLALIHFALWEVQLVDLASGVVVNDEE